MFKVLVEKIDDIKVKGYDRENIAEFIINYLMELYVVYAFYVTNFI